MRKPYTNNRHQVSNRLSHVTSTFFLLIMLLLSGSLSAQITQQFNNNGTFSVPAGVTTLTVYIFGAGGGGGGGTTGSSWANGGGGGGGACSVNTITVGSNTSYTVTVGAAGAAGTPTANGGTGATSSFVGNVSGTFNAAGGTGGAFSTGSAAGVFAGGNGGATGTGTVFAGGNGSAGNDASGITGSGGGAGGSGAPGTAAAGTCSGSGGAGGTGTFAGGVGAYNANCSVTTDLAGTAGTVPGGGGSGNCSWTASNNGGAGAKGRIFVVYTPPCTTPAVATTLGLTPTSTTVTGTFTAPGTAPTGYLVIRTATAAAPTTPVLGTTYTPGTTALGGTIVSTNTTTGFTDNGLSFSTQYWYWVYSYNSGCATTNPVYSATSLNGNTTTTACVVQTNTMAITASGTYSWSTAASWSLGHVPLSCENAVITGSSAINGTATVNMAGNVTVNSLTITLTGGGNASNVDLLVFNTNAFAMTLAGDLTLNNNSTGNGAHQLECNISASGSLTCSNFNSTMNGTGGTNQHVLDVNTFGTFQVNGTTLAKAPEASNAGAQIQVNVGNSPATATFVGAAVFDDGTTSTVSNIYIGTTATTGNTTGSMIFKANTTFGAKAFSIQGNIHGSTVFDAASAQTVTVNNATTMFFPSVAIGSSNSPAVTLAGTGSPIIDATAGTPLGLSVNNSSTLDLATNTFNVSAAATSTLSLAAAATLKVGGTTGGATGSNFPNNYSAYTFTAGSTVEYYGGAQTIFNTPVYDKLVLSTSGIKTAAAALSINSNLTINSPATFAAGSFTHNLGGNWSNAGTFTPATSKIRFNGTGAQTITKSGGETFAGLIVNKASGTLTMLNNVTVTAVLNLNNGLIITGANTLALGNNGSTTNAGSTSYVNGILIKSMAGGTVNPTFTFPFGDATGYAPVTLTGNGTTSAAGQFGGATAAGDLTLPTGSGFDYTKSVNRNWTLGSNLSGISTYDATLNYPSAEKDAGATSANFVAKYTNGTTWFGTTVNGTPSNTAISVTGIASLSVAGYSFQVGELQTFNIVSSSGGNGSISPNGTTAVSYGGSQTYTITPNACRSINKVLVDGVNNPAAVSSGTYTFTNVTAAHTISVTYNTDGPYTITVSAGANGSISPGTGTVTCGSNATYTITPNACYSIANVLVDAVSQGAIGSYTFTNVTGTHTISATFVINTFSATVNAGANGSITPGSATVNCGSNNAYTITPNACYHITDVTLNGVSQGAVGTLNVNAVAANYTVAASFAINTYTITATGGANGSITPATGSVNCGDNATYTITPNACYSIADVVVDGVSQGAVGTYTFTNITTAHSINATFVLNTYTITVTAGANGSVTPATGSINCGNNATYTITPNACYAIADVVVDGVSQGAVGTYTFTNVTAAHSISATFVLNIYTITVTAGANGSITPATGSVNCGSNTTYTITPNACYSIADVVVDGVSQGAVGTYTFTNVTAAHSISATFVLNTYTITVTAGANGSITPAPGSVNCGSNATYTISPNACYSIADVVVDGVSQGAVGTYTFTNVTAAHAINATFVLNTYTITVTAGVNGSITPATGSVNCGDNATYTITANACYSIADVIVDGVSQGAVGTYTFTNVTAAHSISATFVLNTYTITVTAGANGSITPVTGSVNCGDNATYTITANACYSIADVIVDGISQGAVGTYTFTNVTAAHSISATFVLNTYTITVTAGANGSITPATGSVNCGDNATYTITANACYSIADVVADGVSQGAVGTYTFTNVTAAHTISATFVLNTYTITVTAGANGSITPATGSVNCGDNATYTITANACYSIADVIVDGVSQGAVGTYTFTNVTAAHSISATFVLNTYTITVTGGANGSITPATGQVNCGDNATYTITPNACYSIADVVVDGVSQGAVGTYTFTNVTAAHSISATFVLNTYTITVTAGANGSITPATGSVNCGSNATYTITPNACYSIGDVVVDGVSQGAVGTYTFTNVTANHTISATFTLNTYTITVTAGANGSITPATGSVNCGSNATYTITPNACYSIGDVVVDGVSQGAVGTYTFTNVTANHTISATFTLNTYTITVTAGANGSITPATGSVNCGDNATYTITANAGFTISDVVVDGISQGAIGTYTFTNVTAAHTISATFVNNTSFTINASAGANGSISPNGATVVNSGANQTYTITPIACYHVADVLVDGVSVGAVTTYTFTNVTANHTISAGFAVNAALSVSVSGPVNVCPYIGTGDQVTYTATAAGATGFTWVIPPTNVTIISGQGTANLTVTFQNGFQSQANKQLRVTALSPCGNSPLFVYYLLVQTPSTPQPIAGQTSVCSVIGTANTLTYTISSVPGASSYNWVAQQPGNVTITHPNGLGVNDTTVNVSFTNNFTSSSITVSASNLGCGASGVRSLALTKTNPSQPGLISGPTNACAYMAPGGTVATYSIVAVANATAYTWTVPAGATGVTPQGTTSISFTYPNGFVSGTVSVTATNGCGTGVARSLSITKLTPSTPSVIDVIQTASCPNRIYTYTLSSMPANATSVQWTVPAGGTITSGQGASSITVSYDGTAISGNVTAQGISNCGSSTIRISAVKLGACGGGRTITTKGTIQATTATAAETMQVNVFPNPTVSDFKLQVVTAGRQTINVRIMDAQGRNIKQFDIMPYQTINIGADLKAGAYIMETRQGNEVKTTKLLKF